MVGSPSNSPVLSVHIHHVYPQRSLLYLGWMLSARTITKTFDQNPVLDNVSLEVTRGSTTALIGPSGCGKSTLIRIMMGLIEPDKGEVVLAGKVLDRSNKLELRRNAGYVIQKGGLFPHLTAAENCSLVAQFLGWSPQKIRERLNELCELTNLNKDVLDRYPGQLSGGQQQRVSLMRALMLDPKVILLDEPLGSIDPLVRYELQNDLRKIFQELHKTVLLVTHDLGEAAFLGDEIVLMRAGRVEQSGSIDSILKNPANAFVQQFITAQRSPLEDSP